jgi:hypothetical protein
MLAQTCYYRIKKNWIKSCQTELITITVFLPQERWTMDAPVAFVDEAVYKTLIR